METPQTRKHGELPIAEVKQFFTAGSSGAFETLYRQVNRQALAPFFRSYLSTNSVILDAGCGRGDLATQLKLPHPYCIDLVFEQLRQSRRLDFIGTCVQSDLAHLPFEADTFDVIICANVLHYSGFAGLEELHRVTKSNGRLLLAFLERSDYTRWAIELAVCCGVFPPFMRDAVLLDISDFKKLNVIIEDSATVVYLPPWFMVSRTVPRRGMVVYVLRKTVSVNETSLD